MEKKLLNGLTEEQIQKARACKNQEELLALAKKEGIELTDEQLSAVSGGTFICTVTETYKIRCPKCNSGNIWTIGRDVYQCYDCSFQFNA